MSELGGNLQRDGSRFSRRKLLLGGAAAMAGVGGAVASKGFGGRRILDKVLGRCGEGGDLPEAAHFAMKKGQVESRFMREKPGFVVSWPQKSMNSTPMPVCFCLHPKGESSGWILDLRLAEFVASRGMGNKDAPFALAAVDGGDLYWHKRESGEDPMSLFLDEFIPFVEHEFGLGARDAGRAVMGWSMGGYGALLAAQRRPQLFKSVVAVSPAIWTSAKEQGKASPDAFDGTTDFSSNDIFAGIPTLKGTAIRVDCGLNDPFEPATRRFRQSVKPAPSGGFSAGCHDKSYWLRALPSQISFISGHF